MPNYVFQCDAEHEPIEAFYYMTEVPQVLPCSKETCKLPAKRQLGAGAGLICKDTPGTTLRRKAENRRLQDKARVARRMKRSGKVPMDAVIHEKDVDLAKYTGPRDLPPGHPEGIKPAEMPAPRKPKKNKPKRRS